MPTFVVAFNSLEGCASALPSGFLIRPFPPPAEGQATWLEVFGPHLHINHRMWQFLARAQTSAPTPTHLNFSCIGITEKTLEASVEDMGPLENGGTFPLTGTPECVHEGGP